MKRIYNRLAMNLNHRPIQESESIEKDDKNRRRISMPEVRSCCICLVCFLSKSITFEVNVFFVSAHQVDDDSDDEGQKHTFPQDEDDEESLETVVDNDAGGEEEHLKKLAEQNKGPVDDDAGDEQDPGSSSASRESM